MKAFEMLKTIMCQKPILRQPNYDDPFFLLTDASAYGVGAVLLQEGKTNPRSKKPFLHPIAYYSSTFIPAKQGTMTHLRERTSSSPEKPGALEATPGSHGKASHGTNRPR